LFSSKGWKEIIRAEIEQKMEAPGGASLLQIAGYIYVQEAKAKASSFFRFAYGLQKTGHFFSDFYGLVKCVYQSFV
jgi:hypothetical protein